MATVAPASRRQTGPGRAPSPQFADLAQVLERLRTQRPGVVAAADLGTAAVQVAVALMASGGRLLVLERGVLDADRARMRMIRADLDRLCLYGAWNVDATTARRWSQRSNHWLGAAAVIEVLQPADMPTAVTSRQQVLLSPLLSTDAVCTYVSV